MKCIIEGHGVKVFGKAAHALSRIGEEIWLDPLEKGLAVRSVNSSHSAYACFLFSPLFFQHYSPNLDGLQDNKTTKCKISLKSVMPLFRSVATMERSVYRCEITINIHVNRVIFQFKCRHGITKTHNLMYEECEALQAVFPAHLCPNILKAHAKLLSDIIMHFPVSQEEITLSISPMRMKLNNFEEDNDRIRSMYTEMSLHPDEFECFQVGVDSDITFCLKELRGLLSFAETYGLPVSVHFGGSGKPVSFSVEDMLMEAVIVLATVVEPVTERPSQVSVDQESLIQRNLSEVCPADISTKAVYSDVENQHQCFPAGEQVASSQGSPDFNPILHVRKVMQLQGGLDLSKPDAPQSGVSTESAATFKIHSLLFGAIVSDKEEDSALELPSLVYASDTEDDVEEASCRVLKQFR